MAETKRITAHLTPETLTACNARGPLSQSINRMADRYRELCDRAQVAERFTGAELDAIRDALNGWRADPAASIRGGPALEVEDSLEDGLADKWGVDGPALVAKLRALDYAEEVALVDTIERWWQAVSPETLEPQA